MAGWGEDSSRGTLVKARGDTQLPREQRWQLKHSTASHLRNCRDFFKS